MNLLTRLSRHQMRWTHEYHCLSQGIGESLLHTNVEWGLHWQAVTLYQYTNLGQTLMIGDHLLDALIHARYAAGLVHHLPPQCWYLAQPAAIRARDLSATLYPQIQLSAELTLQQIQATLH
jgi:hypothetical protein